MGVYHALDDPGEGQVALRSTISIAVVASVWLSAITVQGAGAIATTNARTIRGEVEGNLRTFRGIPFAAPPVGDLRWRPPQPLANWEGARDATEFGTPCVQPPLAGFYSRGPIEISENCLFLSTARPLAGKDTPSRAEGLRDAGCGRGP